MSEIREKSRYYAEIARAATHWFALLVALAYGTGFLCVFTYLDRFGIHETSGDFFRVKYIHVGILFLLFPLSILGPLWVILSMKRAEYAELDRLKHPSPASDQNALDKKFALPVSAIFSYLNLCLVFYIFILFTPREFALSKQNVIFLIFATSIIGPLITDKLVYAWIVPHKTIALARHARWVVLLSVALPLDYFAFKGFWGQLGRIVWGYGEIPDGAFYYVAFLSLIPWVLWRTNMRSREVQNEKTKAELKLSATALAFMFYFLAIIAFSLKVYPYIPAAKGGGNLEESPTVTLVFRPVFGESISPGISDKYKEQLTKESKFVVVEQSPLSISLADINDANGPSGWRQMRDLPNIIEIDRASVEQVIYQKRPGINLDIH